MGTVKLAEHVHVVQFPQLGSEIHDFSVVEIHIADGEKNGKPPRAGGEERSKPAPSRSTPAAHLQSSARVAANRAVPENPVK